jgi:hypothetical protein
MTTISSNGKIAYIYDTATDTWHPVSGSTNTVANYSWSGTHNFESSATFQDVVTAKAGINNFQNPTARDAAISSPSNGIVCFVRQTNGGSVINQVQYYYNGVWRDYSDSTPLSAQTASYTLALTDAGKTINMNVSASNTVTIPPNSTTPFIIGQRLDVIQTGSGQTSFVEGLGVTIQSKNSNKKIAARYSGATLIKLDTNTWILIGDLTA